MRGIIFKKRSVFFGGLFFIFLLLGLGVFLDNNKASAISRSCKPNEFLVCHKTGTSAGQELCLNQNLLQGHLGHGDKRGACERFADLSIIKTSDRSNAIEGGTIDYLITATNNGPDEATNIIVNDTLPSGVSFVNYNSTKGVYNAGVWSVGSLNSGQNAIIEITVRVNNGQAGQQIINTATISGSETDNNLSNNSASFTIYILSSPSINDDEYSVLEDNVLSVLVPGVLANDTDYTNNLSAQIISNPAHGDIVFNSNGSFVYTPDENFFGTDYFTYKACNTYLLCANATVVYKCCFC